MPILFYPIVNTPETGAQCVYQWLPVHGSLKKKPVIDELNLLNDGKPQLYQKLHQAYLLYLKQS